jgi:hypothetical protein
MAQIRVQPLRNRCEGVAPFAARRCNSTHGPGVRHNRTRDGAAIEWGTKETVMKLATIAFAALSAAIAATPAHAALLTNGIQNNGLQVNGIGINGAAYNSLTFNGVGYNALIGNGVAEQGSAGAKLTTCITGAEPVCELGPIFHVQSVTLGNGKKLDMR